MIVLATAGDMGRWLAWSYLRCPGILFYITTSLFRRGGLELVGRAVLVVIVCS